MAETIHKQSYLVLALVAGFIIGWGVGAIVFNISRDKTVAVVDGVPIKQTELYRAMKNQIGAKTVQRLIDNVIVKKTAQKYGIDISARELDTEMNRKIDLEYHSKEAFLASLATLNMTFEEAREELRLAMLFDRIATRDIRVEESEIRQYYQKHPQEFFRPEMRRIREIVLKTEPEAEEARGRLLNGADFAALVREKSIGLDRDKGGDRGFIAKGLLNPVSPSVEKVVFATGEGGISPVIKCPDGFHIVKVEQIKPQYQAGYEESKQAATLKVKVGKCRPFQDILAKMRQNSSIQLLEDFDRGK